MRKILIIGAGSFATEVEEIAKFNGYDEIAFLDDNANSARCRPVIGTLKEIDKFADNYSEAIVAFGNNQMRMKYHLELLKNGYSIPSLIHPTAYVSKDAQVDQGCIIRAKAVVSRYVHIGSACIINVSAIVDHDCIIGEGSHCLIGSVVRNKVVVPPMTWIEANKVVE